MKGNSCWLDCEFCFNFTFTICKKIKLKLKISGSEPS